MVAISYYIKKAPKIILGAFLSLIDFCETTLVTSYLLFLAEDLALLLLLEVLDLLVAFDFPLALEQPFELCAFPLALLALPDALLAFDALEVLEDAPRLALAVLLSPFLL